MNSSVLFFVNKLVSCLPATRMSNFKCRLFKLAGVKIGYKTRLMNIKVLGVGDLVIGENSFVGENTFFTGGKANITVGNYCDISSNVIITTGTHKIDMIGPRSAGEGYADDITIMDGVWIGIGTIILPGVVIGEKSIIAAGSVVNKSIPPFTIAGGVPCKPIKQWDKNLNSWAKII
jgi:maltose O-acetyltransferase